MQARTVPSEGGRARAVSWGEVCALSQVLPEALGPSLLPPGLALPPWPPPLRIPALALSATLPRRRTAPLGEQKPRAFPCPHLVCPASRQGSDLDPSEVRPGHSGHSRGAEQDKEISPITVWGAPQSRLRKTREGDVTSFTKSQDTRQAVPSGSETPQGSLGPLPHHPFWSLVPRILAMDLLQSLVPLPQPVAPSCHEETPGICSMLGEAGKQPAWSLMPGLSPRAGLSCLLRLE